MNLDEERKIEQLIKNSDEEKENKINWTKAWGKKYPVLLTYQQVINVDEYASQIREMLDKLQKEYKYNNVDSMLVLKDILYHEWKDKSSQETNYEKSIEK